MKLIAENIEGLEIESRLCESTGEKEFYVYTPYGIQMDVKNHNGRIYPSSVMNPIVEKFIVEKLEKQMAWGELDHPPTSKIDPKNVSHRFVAIEKNGVNYWSLKAKVLNSPSGQIVRALIDDGKGTIGMSTRGVGKVDETKNGDIVQEGYIIVTPGDIVLDPSAQRAFVNGIYEGKEFDFIDGILHERIVNTIRKEYKSSMTMSEQLSMYEKTFSNMMGYIRESMIKKGGPNHG